jgi:predicted GNAT family N-acyltransferase
VQQTQCFGIRLYQVKGTIRVKQVSSKQELKHAFSIRMRVFVKEQGVPEEIELDLDDERAFHFLAFKRDKPIATARVVMRARNAKIGRMAVMKQNRRRGVGKKLLRQAIRFANRKGAEKIFLHAQVAVIGFYAKAGFHCTGPVFSEAGIPHRKMVLPTQRQR